MLKSLFGKPSGIQNLTHEVTLPNGAKMRTEKVFTKIVGGKIGEKLDEWTDNVTTHDDRQKGEVGISVGSLKVTIPNKKSEK